jgi:hypothetical protein
MTTTPAKKIALGDEICLISTVLYQIKFGMSAWHEVHFFKKTIATFDILNAWLRNQAFQFDDNIYSFSTLQDCQNSTLFLFKLNELLSRT